MNPIWKLCCRVYQFAFHVALPILPYREPEIFDRIQGLIPMLKERNIKSVLLVTDNVLRFNGITAPLERLLQMNGIKLAVYDKTCAKSVWFLAKSAI